MSKCDYADERVTHNGRPGYCRYVKGYCFRNGDGTPPFDRKVERVERKDVCYLGSPFGDYHIGLTDEQIESLKKGEVFAILDEEYGIFIARVDEEGGAQE